MKQFNQPGVYILRQADAQHVLPKIYIGQANPMKERLNNHYANKDFWEDVFICVGDIEGKLNKAHIGHLESRMIQMAKLAKSCDLENNQEPMPPALAIADEALVANFLTKLLFVLRVLGLNIFETPSISSIGGSGEKDAKKMFSLKTKKVTAKARRDSGRFIVLANSEAVLREVDSASYGIIALRKTLQAKGVLKVANDRCLFTQDWAFSSPSAAAQAVVGGPADGRILWKNELGKSIKVLEAEAAGSTENITG